MADRSIDELWASLEGDGPVHSRIEALRDLEKATKAFGKDPLLERLEGLIPALSEPVASAVGRAAVRARRRRYAASENAGDSMKLELAQQLLGDGDAAARKQFIEASLENEAFETLPALADHLTSEKDADNLALLARALGVLGGKEQIAALKKATRSEHARVRMAAVDALTYQRGRDRSRLLLERLTDPEESVRKKTLECLDILPRDEVLGILESIPAGKGSKLRRASVAYLRRHPESPRGRDLLRQYMASDNMIVAAEALLALARLGDDGALARIMELDGKTDEKMQKILEMAKKAYSAAAEEESRSVGDEGSDGDAESMHEELVGGTAAATPHEPVIRSPNESFPPVIALGPAPDPGSAASPEDEALGFSDTVAQPSDPGSLASQETVIEEAPAPSEEAPPAESEGDPLAAMDEDVGENPWDSIAQAPGSGFDDFSTPSSPPAEPEREEEAGGEEPPAEEAEALKSPVEPTFDIPGPEKAPPTPGPTPGPAPGPGPGPEPGRPLWFRLLLLFLLLGGLGFTGYFAYSAGQAANRVDRSREKLDSDFNSILRAIEKHDNATGRHFTSEVLDPLVPTFLPALPRDPWGSPYLYDQVLGRLISPGPDGTRDRSARHGGGGVQPDDQMRFRGEVPPPMAISFRGPQGFQLVGVIPGTMETLSIELDEAGTVPVHPTLPPGKGKIAYLDFDGDKGLFVARWRRARAGSKAWEEAQDVFPEGWECSSLSWFPDGSALLTVASPPNKPEGLYGVVPGETPVLLTKRVKEPANPWIHPDGRRILLSALDRDGKRKVLMGVLPRDQLTADGLRARWGPPGELPFFGKQKSNLYYVGPDPRMSSRTALLEWHDVQDKSAGYEGEAAGRVIHSLTEPITNPTLSEDGSQLAFSTGKKVFLLDLETRGLVEVFEAPRQILSVTWPYPAPMGSK